MNPYRHASLAAPSRESRLGRLLARGPFTPGEWILARIVMLAIVASMLLPANIALLVALGSTLLTSARVVPRIRPFETATSLVSSGAILVATLRGQPWAELGTLVRAFGAHFH